jgi:hypothetical protein
MLLVGFCVYFPTSSLAEPSVGFHAALVPERPGHRVSAQFSIQIAGPGGAVPPPLTQASVRYPAGLGLALSGLGIESCTRQTLELIGAQGCPASSIMGEGSAIAEIQFGPDVLSEEAHVSLLRTPERPGDQLAMLFLVDAEHPVSAQPILDGLLSATPPPYGGRIDIAIPPIESLPGASDVALVRIHLVIGPRSLTYYEHVAGKLIPYHPRGLRLPAHCPRGGYPFALALRFLDGSQGTATTSVPCPTLHRPMRRRGDRQLISAARPQGD